MVRVVHLDSRSSVCSNLNYHADEFLNSEKSEYLDEVINELEKIPSIIKPMTLSEILNKQGGAK